MLIIPAHIAVTQEGKTTHFEIVRIILEQKDTPFSS